MKSGYKIRWTKHALNELARTLEYLEKNFSEKEIRRLAWKIESTTEMLARNPKMFPESETRNVRKVVILKHCRPIKTDFDSSLLLTGLLSVVSFYNFSIFKSKPP